jgi:AcrR family transcriptional regulator
MVNEHRSGPVRSAAAREAILDATSRLFHAQGYDRLTIEGIAKEAGVGKQTIYRWWPSRGALIADCLVDGRLVPVDFVVPDTADLQADVETWLGSVFGILATTQGQALLQSLVAAAAEDAAVGAHLGGSLGVEQHLSERLRGGIRDGQLPEDAPIAQIGRAILGAIIVESLGRESHGPQGIIDLIRYLFTR